jgi:hypothetical protein
MPITLNGTGSISGLSVGGLNDGIITQPELALGVAGTGPAFAAYEGTTQALTANVVAKLVFGTELFDTNNNFASSTFTPTIAGYYQLSGGSYINAAGTKLLNLYKNGVLLYEFGRNGSNTDTTLSGSAIAYANGSTDYFDIYGFSSVTASAGVAGLPGLKWFTGALVRAA